MTRLLTTPPMPDNHATAPLDVMVAMLCGQERHHWICPHLSLAVTSWALDPRVDGEYGTGTYHQELCFDYSTSQEARNEAMRRFLESDAEFLVMVDNDTQPVHPTKHHMINAIDLASWNLPIVAAPVATMTNAQLNWHINAYMLNPDGKAYRPITLEEHQGTVSVDAVGFGLVCIRRDVVAVMKNSASRFGEGPSSLIKSNAEDALGQRPKSLPIVMRSRALDGSTVFGEDLLFSHRARQHGIPSYVAHPAYICGHYHTQDIGRLPQMSISNHNPETDTVHSESAIDNKPQQVNAARERALTEAELADIDTTNVLYDHLHKHAGLEKGYEYNDWMMHPKTLAWLYQYCSEFDQTKVLNILEYGSGLSTAVMLKGLSKRDGLHRLLSLEHDKEMAAQTLELIRHQFSGFDCQPTGYHVRLTELWNNFYEYEQPKLEVQSFDTFDLVVADGPPGHLDSRRQILDPGMPYSKHYRKGTLIVWDDCYRDAERRAMEVAIETGIVTLVKHISPRTALLRWELEWIPTKGLKPPTNNHWAARFRKWMNELT